MTLREAARRTSRSVTTLRRYIRSGRLCAEKRQGRFGPEYFVTEQDLASAGLKADPPESRNLPATRDPQALAPTQAAPPHESVPISLYQELQMKHEQLLVQYGMVRAGGMRVMELRAELDTRRKELQHSEERIARLKRSFAEETERLKRLLRRAELEQEGRGLEIAALREKVRALEMLTRNAETSETIEKQFGEVMDQMRRVDRLTEKQQPRTPGPDPDH